MLGLQLTCCYTCGREHSFCSSFAPDAMASQKVKVRLVADPSIAVTDLAQCFECWIDENGVTKVTKVLEPPSGTNWKTAVETTWLCKLANLWKKYLSIAPNGVLPAAKHRSALQSVAEKKKLDHGKKTSKEFSEQGDEWIRIALSQLRNCKQYDMIKTRAWRKATPEEIPILNELLEMLIDVEVEGSPKNLPPEPSKETSIVVASENASSSSATPAPLKLEFGDDEIDPGKIFETVLNKNDSPKIDRHRHSSTSGAPEKATGDLLPFQGFVSGLKNMGLVSDEETSILHRSQKQEPVNRGYTSQLQRANKAMKEKEETCDGGEHNSEKQAAKKTEKGLTSKDPKMKKAKAKAKAKSTKKKHTADMEQDQVHSPPPMKKKKKKKKANKGDGKGKKRKTIEKDKQVAEQESKQQGTPEGFDSTTTRAVNRKRFTSRAWHAAFDRAQNDGLDTETSKERAREASQAASKEFETLWPIPKRSPTVKKKGKKTMERADEEESEHPENVD